MFRVSRFALSVPVGFALGSSFLLNKRSGCDAYQNESLQYIVKTLHENQIVVFSKTRCRYCVIAKGILDSMNLKYKVVELDVMENGGSVGYEISRITGMNTIPIIFVNGKLIGGCDSLQACIKNGSFQEELKNSRETIN